MTPAQQALAPAAAVLPLPPEMQAFIAAGHDPDLAHWLDCPSVYADFVVQYRAEHLAGAA